MQGFFLGVHFVKNKINFWEIYYFGQIYFCKITFYNKIWNVISEILSQYLQYFFLSPLTFCWSFFYNLRILKPNSIKIIKEGHIFVVYTFAKDQLYQKNCKYGLGSLRSSPPPTDTFLIRQVSLVQIISYHE